MVPPVILRSKITNAFPREQCHLSGSPLALPMGELEAGIVPPRLGIEFIFHLHKEYRYPLGTLFHARLPHDIQMP